MRGRLSTAVAVVVSLASVAATSLAAASAAGAASPPAPLTVHSATLAQSARNLVWTVTMTARFSPAGLAAQGRTLCLLIRRPAGGATGQLCFAPPRRGKRRPGVVYQRITRAGPGAARPIAATVTRHGGQDATVTFVPTAIGNDYRTLRWQVLSTLSAPPCPAAAGQARCVAVYPAPAALTRLHLPRLAGCAATGPPLVFAGPGTRRQIALTFDDGPWYETAQFVNLLEHLQAPATFFEIGRQVAPFGEGGALERRMLADGDMIGDHTWSHPDLAAGAPPFVRSQIQDTADAIRAATGGFLPCLFRPPYGVASPALVAEVRSLGFTTVQWNIDPRDWARPGVAAIVGNVLANARPGAIVEMHDGGGDRSQTLAALPQIIDTLRVRGYTFVTVTQLLGQRLLYR